MESILSANSCIIFYVKLSLQFKLAIFLTDSTKSFDLTYKTVVKIKQMIIHKKFNIIFIV